MQHGRSHVERPLLLLCLQKSEKNFLILNAPLLIGGRQRGPFRRSALRGARSHYSEVSILANAGEGFAPTRRKCLEKAFLKRDHLTRNCHTLNALYQFERSFFPIRTIAVFSSTPIKIKKTLPCLQLASEDKDFRAHKVARAWRLLPQVPGERGHRGFKEKPSLQGNAWMAINAGSLSSFTSYLPLRSLSSSLKQGLLPIEVRSNGSFLYEVCASTERGLSFLAI